MFIQEYIFEKSRLQNGGHFVSASMCYRYWNSFCIDSITQFVWVCVCYVWFWLGNIRFYPYHSTFKGADVEMWTWISNLILYFTCQGITYPCWHLNQFIKVAPVHNIPIPNVLFSKVGIFCMYYFGLPFCSATLRLQALFQSQLSTIALYFILHVQPGSLKIYIFTLSTYWFSRKTSEKQTPWFLEVRRLWTEMILSF